MDAYLEHGDLVVARASTNDVVTGDLGELNGNLTSTASGYNENVRLPYRGKDARGWKAYQL